MLFLHERPNAMTCAFDGQHVGRCGRPIMKILAFQALIASEDEKQLI